MPICVMIKVSNLKSYTRDIDITMDFNNPIAI